MKKEGIDYVVCPICNKRYQILSVHLVKTHGVSIEHIRNEYPELNLTSKRYHDKRVVILKRTLHGPDCQCCFCKMKRGELKGENSPKYGKHYGVLSEEHKQKIRVALENAWKDPEKRENMLQWTIDDPEYAHEAKSNAGKRANELHPDMWQHALKVYHIDFKKDHPEEYHKQRINAGRKSVEANHLRPNGLEQKFIELIEKYDLPYKYVGGGSIWIGRKNPDFINTNGKKEVIELFGNYWHGEKIIGVPNKQHEQEYIKHYKKFGYICHILWEHEIHKLSNKDEIIRRLKL